MFETTIGTQRIIAAASRVALAGYKHIIGRKAMKNFITVLTVLK